MLKSPLWFLSDSTARIGLIAAVVLLVPTWLILQKAAAPIPRYGANIPQTLLRSTNPERDAKDVVKNLEPADDSKDAVFWMFMADFAFLSAFFLALCFGCEVASRSAALINFAPLSRFMGWSALVGAAADILEDSVWLVMIRRDASHTLAQVAAWSTRMKFTSACGVGLFLLGGVFFWIGRRLSEGTSGGG